MIYKTPKRSHKSPELLFHYAETATVRMKNNVQESWSQNMKITCVAVQLASSSGLKLKMNSLKNNFQIF